MVERRSERKEKVPKGDLEVVTGSMFCGKTDELIRRLKREEIALKFKRENGLIDDEEQNEYIKVFKPVIDKRYSEDKVDSHAGDSFPAIVVDQTNPSEILGYIHCKTKVVAIDEAQFFSDEVVDIADQLTDRGIRVIVAGLDTDFRREPFGPMGALLAKAQKVDKFTAKCVLCGEDADCTQRVLIEDGDSGKRIRRPARYDDPVVVVGASELYEARCRDCHEVIKEDK